MTDTAGTSGTCLWPFLAAGIPVFLHAWLMPVLRFSGEWTSDANYGVLNDIARGQSDPPKNSPSVGRNDPDRWLPETGQSTGFSVLVRSLLKSERPSGLTQAIIEVGRINKTLYLLNYIDDEDYRRRIPDPA